MKPEQLQIGQQVLTPRGLGTVKLLLHADVFVALTIPTPGDDQSTRVFPRQVVARPRRYAVLTLFSGRPGYWGTLDFWTRQEALTVMQRRLKQTEARVLVSLIHGWYTYEQTGPIFRYQAQATLINVPVDTYGPATIRTYSRVPRRWPIHPRFSLDQPARNDTTGLGWSFLFGAYASSQSLLLRHGPYSSQGWLDISTLKLS